MIINNLIRSIKGKIKMWYVTNFKRLNAQGICYRNYVEKMANGEIDENHHISFYDEKIDNMIELVKEKTGEELDRIEMSKYLAECLNKIKAYNED